MESPDKAAVASGSNRAFDLAFLSEAGAVLSSSLDYATTLASVVELIVPRLADWCTLELLGDDGVLHFVAAAHADPEKLAAAQELQRRYRQEPNANHGGPDTVRTGRSIMVSEFSEDVIASDIADPETRRLLHELDFTSSMAVPLIARGRALGSLTFAMGDSGRRYDHASLAFAEELAGRAALAVDNARLYGEARQAEENLRESEQSFRHPFQDSPEPMWVFDLETFQFLEVNDTAIEKYGYSREEFLALRITDIRSPGDPEALAADLRENRYRWGARPREWCHRL